MIRYTPEQADVMDFITANDGILLVQAGAGTGKSFMSRQIVKELNPKSGIYTAFNKAIVEEGVSRFRGTYIECKTFHALAYRYAKPEKSIETFSYRCITERLTYAEKRRVISTIDKFYVSSATCMYEFFAEAYKDHPREEYLTDICAKYVEGMADGEINPTFNFLLKCLHLMLVEGTVSIDVDIVILDEINDVTAVSLEIFKLINAPKKLGLGETHQAIYQFLNLVNGFEELADKATTMYFTQSYRCSTQIAERINKSMVKNLDSNFKFIGTDEPVANGLTLYCTLTNASIVSVIYDRLRSNKGFQLLRKPADIFAAPLAVLTASQGKKPYQRQYHYLLDLFEEYKDQTRHKTFFKFLNSELNDEEINNAVKLLMKLATNGVNLFTLYTEAKNAKVDKTYTIATVFTSKGLEYETVYIADDLNTRFKAACDGNIDNHDEAVTAKRCYYVACSRAGSLLRNSVL